MWHRLPADEVTVRSKPSAGCRCHVFFCFVCITEDRRYNRLPMKQYHVAIVGATGAVGGELLRVLERRGFPVASLRAIGSARSHGKSVSFRSESIAVEQLNEKSFEKGSLAFFSAGGEISRKFVPVARQAGAIVIDNSSVFRMDPDVPLVIP